MSEDSRTSWYWMFLGLGALLFLFFTPQGLQAKNPIKIGMIDCFSGGAAAFTKPAPVGWKMVVDEFNAKGGFKGRKIEILTRDDKFKPDEA